MAGSGMQGGPGGYAQLMQSLMQNPAAFTGGGFGQTLAANPGGASLAAWQPSMPGQQTAPAQSFQWGQQYPQAAQQPNYGSSPLAQALASFQAAAPAQQAAANPIQTYIQQQQAAQAAPPPAAAQPVAQPIDNSVSTGGSE